MNDNTPDNPQKYCSLPGLFGKKFDTWFNEKFSEACHEHDIAYGSLHPKTMTRLQADNKFRDSIKAGGFPVLAQTVWMFLRVAGRFWWQDYTGA